MVCTQLSAWHWQRLVPPPPRRGIACFFVFILVSICDSHAWCNGLFDALTAGLLILQPRFRPARAPPAPHRLALSRRAYARVHRRKAACPRARWANCPGSMAGRSSGGSFWGGTWMCLRQLWRRRTGRWIQPTRVRSTGVACASQRALASTVQSDLTLSSSGRSSGRRGR